MWVKSSVPYLEFTQGRDTESSFHREDDSAGEVCGWVEVSRSGDVEISQSDYETLAQAIRDYNDSLPVVIDVAVTNAARLEELNERMADGTITSDETAELLRRERGLQDRYEQRQAEIAANC